MRESMEQSIRGQITALLKETQDYDDALLYVDDIVKDTVEQFPGPLKETVERAVIAELKAQSGQQG